VPLLLVYLSPVCTEYESEIGRQKKMIEKNHNTMTLFSLLFSSLLFSSLLFLSSSSYAFRASLHV